MRGAVRGAGIGGVRDAAAGHTAGEAILPQAILPQAILQAILSQAILPQAILQTILPQAILPQTILPQAILQAMLQARGWGVRIQGLRGLERRLGVQTLRLSLLNSQEFETGRLTG